jgi:hypothetical protein
MEVQYLEYIGPKVEGTIVNRKESALSKWRQMRVYQGMRLEVGREIPATVVKNLRNMLGDQFKVVTVQLDDVQTFKNQFADIVTFYKNQYGDDAVAVVPAIVVEATLAVLGEESIIPMFTAMKESDEIEVAPSVFKKHFDEVFKTVRTVKRRPKAKAKPKVDEPE